LASVASKWRSLGFRYQADRIRVVFRVGDPLITGIRVQGLVGPAVFVDLFGGVVAFYGVAAAVFGGEVCVDLDQQELALARAGRARAKVALGA